MLIKNNYKAILFFLKGLKWQIVLIISYAIIASLFDHSPVGVLINIPITISTVIATMISLLLAFRIAQSYDRWWEARKVWGEIVNDSRTLIRQIMLFIPNPNSEERKSEIKIFAERQIIWCYTLSESLRVQKTSSKVQQYLTAHNLQADNIPLLLIQKHSENLHFITEKYTLNSNQQVQIDTTIARLTDAMGKCERIKNTVFPKNYSYLIHCLIYLFVTLLPFGLSEIDIITEILLTSLIPLMFIAFEKTAIIMQDPFENIPTDIPMTTICNTIENNINQIIGEVNYQKENMRFEKYYKN
ncbi:bestrophin family protein [Flavobacterium sp.]|uniref:bestrophin family protein n=1 Tax=unclassified Flavobacterium TaxID=196869 RepID=UPI0025BE2A6E|nr:bestrophin family ion channel [Flavobacterium sp.]